MNLLNKHIERIILLLLILSSIGTFMPWQPFRLVAGLLYAIIIPGALLWLLLGNRRSSLWTNIVYTVGLGVIFNMLIGALTSSFGHAIGIARPFSHIPLLIGYGIFSLLLLVIYHRQKETIYVIKKPTFNRESLLTLITTLVMFACVVFGSFLLNNGGSGILSLCFYLYIPIAAFYLILRKDHLNENIVITILFLLGYGLMLSGWLRSYFISGPDISLEYAISELTKDAGLWSLELFKSAYNSCLSVGVLGPSISIFTDLSVIVVYKAIIPLLYSMVVPIAYMVASKYSNSRNAIIAAVFFIAQPVFVVWWWIPARQEIAFLIFGLIILSLFNTFSSIRKATINEILLFVLLGCGLVVAHYSTAVLSIAYLLITWIVAKIAIRRQYMPVNILQFVNIKYIALLVFAYVIWYGQITYGLSGLTDFFSKTTSKISSITDHKSTANGTDFLSQFSLFATPGVTKTSIPQYIEQREKIAANYFGKRNLYDTDSSHYIHKAEQQQDSAVESVIGMVRKVIIILGKVGLIASVIMFTLYSFRKKTNPEFLSIVPAALVLLGLTILLPAFSVSYDQVRTYQQMLIVMGGVGGLALIFKGILRYKATVALMGFVCIYFIFVSNTLSYFTASPSVPTGLANRGNDYQSYYVNQAEVSTGIWLRDHKEAEIPISGDSYARNKLRITLHPKLSQTVSTSLVPTALPKKGYIVAFTTNKQKGIAYATVGDGLITYKYPYEFIESEKNAVYSTAETTIYR